MQIAVYKAHFKNHHYSTEILIKNDFEYLTFELDGVQFEGSSFYDFEVLNYEMHKDEVDKKFVINKVPYLHGGFCREICEYQMTVFLPIEIKEIETGRNISGDIKIDVSVGKSSENGWTDKVRNVMTLSFLGDTFTGEDYDFEGAANKILKKIKPKFTFHNCFGCKFSDYSYLGSAEFGSMLCFKNQKEQYVKVKSKTEYMNLDTEDRVVQEIFVCNEFEVRGNVIGYRG